MFRPSRRCPILAHMRRNSPWSRLTMRWGTKYGSIDFSLFASGAIRHWRLRPLDILKIPPPKVLWINSLCKQLHGIRGGKNVGPKVAEGATQHRQIPRILVEDGDR